MCESCWNDLGRPAKWNPSVERAVELIRVIYATEPTGGQLHVVLDDWNLEDVHIRPFEVQVSAEAACATEELVPLLLSMPIEERAAALAYFDGFAKVPAGSA